MTTELEKQFFQCFGIEPKYQDTCTVEEKYWDNEELANEYGTFDQYMNTKCGNQENCSLECSCAYQKEIYPQITDRQYLELLKLLMIDEGIKINVYNIQDESKSYKEFGITCLDYFYDEPECNEEDYEPIQSTGTLEECILKALILIEEKYKGYLKHQVQAKFEGKDNENRRRN